MNADIIQLNFNIINNFHGLFGIRFAKMIKVCLIFKVCFKTHLSLVVTNRFKEFGQRWKSWPNAVCKTTSPYPANFKKYFTNMFKAMQHLIESPVVLDIFSPSISLFVI